MHIKGQHGHTIVSTQDDEQQRIKLACFNRYGGPSHWIWMSLEEAASHAYHILASIAAIRSFRDHPDKDTKPITPTNVASADAILNTPSSSPDAATDTEKGN